MLVRVGTLTSGVSGGNSDKSTPTSLSVYSGEAILEIIDIKVKQLKSSEEISKFFSELV